VTVLTTDLPFFGITVTVSLQEPTLSAFRFVPDTVQYFAETAETFKDNRDVDDSHVVWIGGKVATCISGEVEI